MDSYLSNVFEWKIYYVIVHKSGTYDLKNAKGICRHLFLIFRGCGYGI